LLEVKGLAKEYRGPGGALPILSDVSLALGRGEAASIMGPSGSGKSTLLYILGALEPPTAGEVRLDGQDPFALAERGLAEFRNRKVGFVFQDHCLLPQCTVLENVLTPTLVGEGGGAAAADFETRARELLEQVGLAGRITRARASAARCRSPPDSSAGR
jgi:lipoprotein-releasing system ATP-binding protein